MKKSLLIISSLLATVCSAQKSDFVQNQIIAELKPQFDASMFKNNSRINQINDSLKLESSEVIGDQTSRRTFVLKFRKNVNVEEIIKIYQNTNLFNYVEPNFIAKGHGVYQITPNDPLFLARQWSHYNDGSFSLSPTKIDADIDTDLAWDITIGDANLVVAILDTGVKLNHPEFSGRSVAGFDFVNNDTDPTDDFGHGTNVAGIALAKGNNSIGYAGVNWNSKIMSCKILDSNNSGLYSWMASGIYFAVDNGAKVINLSAGGNGASTLLENAVNYAYSKNVSVVVSTGNGNSTIQYPAKYENTFAIGSTNSDDKRSVPFFWDATSGSNFGSELDFVAPGNYIYGLSHTSNTNYNTYWGGTSQAAPHVTGIISLMLSVNPALTVDQIRQILKESSEDQVGDSFDTLGWDQYYGYGRVNAFRALKNPLLASTDSAKRSANIKLFPNPINRDHSFFISGLEPNISYEITIVSLDGKFVTKSKNNQSNGMVKIETSDIPAGVYMVNITDLKQNFFYSKKLIKN